jgi:hypothetical protein
MPPKESFCKEIVNSNEHKLVLRLRGFIYNLLPETSADRKRLTASIDIFREELNLMTESAGSESSWARAAWNMLNKAQDALNKDDFQLGWRYLSTAKNISLLGLERFEREAAANDILEEAKEKLSSWRRKAIVNRLCRNHELKTCISNKDLFHASRILQEHFDNNYFKIGAFKRHLTILFLITIITLGVIIILVPYWNVSNIPIISNSTISDIQINRGFFLAVLAFGVLGAAISGILSARGGIEAKIPDQKIVYRIMLVKIAVGAASALVISIFITSHILHIPFQDHAPGTILAVAFAAGFTERLVNQAVDSVAQIDSKK